MIVFILACLFIPAKTSAYNSGFPKLANFYTGWDLSKEDDINQMAKWDLVILSPEAVESQPQLLIKLHQKNPQIKILAYVCIQEINITPSIVNATPFYQIIYQTVNQNNWWLRNSNGQNVNWWPATWLINVATIAPKTNGQNWGDFLPQLLYDRFLKSNQSNNELDKWDGIFYDNGWAEISWLKQPLDFNADGIADSPTFMDEQWRAGITKILNTTHSLAPDKLVMTNNATNYYNNILNGRLEENFPNQTEGGWLGSIKDYSNANFGYTPSYFVINATTYNKGTAADYQTFRFGLTSALLGNGYYSFDFGDLGHDRVWWYDEYNIYLGNSVSGAKNLLDQTSSDLKLGVWERDFQNGLSLVNSTSTEQKISLSADFEKIKGTQDPAVNNGAIIKTLTLKPSDGIVLLRRIDEIKDSPYYNGAFIRIFDKNGNSLRNGFFTYNKQYKGGTIVALKDINKDGQTEIIVADSSKIIIYDSHNNILNSFYPYGQNYNKGLNFALTDFDNDGYYEIVTGTMKGYAPLVKIFNYQGQAQGSGFYAYAKSYLGGVNVAVGDLTGNGHKEIVTGTGFLGGPQIRIFDKNGKVLSGGFFAYAKNFRGGVNVACGDIDGNGLDEIVTGAGYGGSSQVRIFNSKFQPINPGFWAFDKNSITGVRVILNDLNSDGIKEILAASPDTFTTALNFKSQ